MWITRQTELLLEEIDIVLSPLSKFDDLYNLVKEPLTAIGRGVAGEASRKRPWSLLPLIVCEAVCGRYEQALPAAAARQFLLAAADVFDDVEDDDSSVSLAAKYGPAAAVNAATTLLILAEKALTRLEARGVEEHLIVRVIDTVNSFYVIACAGQHMDLFPAPDITASEDLYLKMIDMKSASQVQCACCAGALLAGASQVLVDKFSSFGHNLGMADQITNDIQGILRGKISKIIK